MELWLMLLVLGGVMAGLVLGYIYRFPILLRLGLLNLRRYTRAELARYDGRSSGPVLLACKGFIFDVSKSPNYKPGGTYHLFAGHDATVALAKVSLNPIDLDATETTSLTADEQQSVDKWFSYFKDTNKYPIVGVLAKSDKDS